MRVAVFVCVCEKDKEWIPQFQREARKNGFPIYWYGDHLATETLVTLDGWVHNEQEELFSEKSKMIPFKQLQKDGFEWAIQMDVDETFEAGFREKLDKIETDAHAINVKMVTVYKEPNGLFRRTDGTFSPMGRESSRERIYNLKYTWNWIDPFTNGAYLQRSPDEEYRCFQSDLTTVHWGYSEPRLREEHRKKWHEVYMKFGRNPYSTYDWLTDPNVVPELIPLEDKYVV